MPCSLSSCLLALKSSLCMSPQAQLFWSTLSQINWTRSFEIPSSLPSLPIFQGFHKLFSLLRKRKSYHLERQILGSLIRPAFLLKGPLAPQASSSETPFTPWWLDAGLSGVVALATTSVCCKCRLVLGHPCFPLCLIVQERQINRGLGEIKEVVQWVIGRGGEQTQKALRKNTAGPLEPTG